MADETKPESAKSTEPATKKSATKPTPKSGKKRRSRKKSAPAAKVRKVAAVRAKPAAKPRARRKESTPAERANILAAADRDGLTALQVQKRFGVKPVTYYSWRKAIMKSGPNPSSRRTRGGGRLDLAGQIREALRAQIAAMLPIIIRDEVRAAIGGASVRPSRRK